MSTLSFGQLTKNSIGDFFHIADDYPLRIAKYTNMHLQEQEGVKTRQIYGNLCSIANGLAFSVPSHGGSMIVCIFAARRLYVAVHKLRFIQQELHDRFLPLRPVMKRDWMIPVSVAITGAALSWGLDFGLSQFVPIGHISLNTITDPVNHLNLPGTQEAVVALQPHQLAQDGMYSVVDQTAQVGQVIVPTTGQSMSAMANDTTSAWQGFQNGVEAQWNAIFGSGPIGVQTAVPNGYAVNNLAEAAGFVSGAEAAQVTERVMVGQLGAVVLQFASDKLDFESLKRRRTQLLSCRRMPFSTRVVCQECVMPIEDGLYFHSCGGNNFRDEDDDPDDDEYDVCLDCFQTLKDLQFRSTLRPMYMAVPGDSCHPGLNATTLVDLQGPKTVLCQSCEREITQGWYYDCWQCREVDKRWMFCQECYGHGGGCIRNKTHRLFAFQRSRVAKYDSNTPYQKKGPKGSKETGRASCSQCSINIERGAYYHCSKCDKGDFTLCTRCHMTEKHCHNSSHVLTKYYAWKYKRDYDTLPASKWQCSNPDCLNLNFDVVAPGDRLRTTGPGTKRMKFKFFYSCRARECKDREYGLCPPCYYTDLTCPVKEHDIFKCYFTKS